MQFPQLHNIRFLRLTRRPTEFLLRSRSPFTFSFDRVRRYVFLVFALVPIIRAFVVEFQVLEVELRNIKSVL
jgi:hypothetical protein